MRSSYGALSDVGLTRLHNEDRFCAEPSLGLYAVCDGMGGRNAGETASTLAIDTIREHMQAAAREPTLPLVGPLDPAFSMSTNRLASAIRLANQVIYEEAQRRPAYAGMGTTVVAALIRDQVLSLAHVGDSRLYLIRDQAIQLLTADHSVAAEQVRQGLMTEEEAHRSSQKNVLTRALGVQPTVEVELGERPIRSNDLLLLCSDGLTRGLTSREILEALHEADNSQALSNRLIAMANDVGGEDNTTVVLIAIHSGNQHGLWRRVRDRFKHNFCSHSL